MRSFLTVEQAELAARMHVIVLGSTEHLTGMVREHLSGLFADIDFTAEPERVLELLTNRPCQILLVELDGDREPIFSVIEKAVRINQELQIIYFSNQPDAEEMLMAINAGVAGFLVQPVFMTNLQRVLKKILTRLLARKNMQKSDEGLSAPQLAINYQHQWFRHQLSVDPLTGLFNRTKLTELLSRPEQVALLLVNLDDFSQLNLGYGFEFGDSVLRAVADFIEARLPSNSLAFRLQADEFAIVLDNPAAGQERLLAQEVLENLPKLNLKVLDLGIKIGCSIGVARGRGMDLVRQASLALLDARSRGRANLQEYHPGLSIERRQKENLLWINRLKLAFENNGFFPVFQPILDNRSGEIYKYECLIRMNGKDNEVILPGQFLQPAKIAGLLPLITGAIVEKSFPYLAGNDLQLSINVTEQDFRGLFLVDYLQRKTEELEIEPRRITLEILEEIDSSATSLMNSQLAELRGMGFRVAIDDFGVSGSNFSRITELKPDFIKIDGRFVRGIHKDPDLQKIVHVIHQVARGIDAQVVAEFVSSKEDFHFIRDLGIEYSQGYYISEPLPVPRMLISPV